MDHLKDQDFPPLPPSKRGRISDLPNDRRPADNARSTNGALANINDLPDELVLAILHFLVDTDVKNSSLQPLFNLSQTNRFLHRVVADKLYASFNSDLCEPYLFLRTIISNKHLAGHIQHADMQCAEISRRRHASYMSSAQDKKTIKEGIRALSIPNNWKGWVTMCNAMEPNFDVLYTTILMHTPNVSSINARYCTMCTDCRDKSLRWIDLIKGVNIGSPVGKMHRFNKLRSLSFETDQGHFDQIYPIF